MRGPTIRRGARIGGGAVLLPGVEIGEEAFVGAGAVVLATCLRERWSSGIPRGGSATCPTTSSSADSQLKLNSPVEPGTSPVEDGGARRAR